MPTKGASVTAELKVDASQVHENLEISNRTIDRWIFEQELRKRRREELRQAVYYAVMISMAVVVILVPIHWALKVAVEAILLWIAFMVWALTHTEEIDQDIPLSRDEMIMEEELRRREI